MSVSTDPGSPADPFSPDEVPAASIDEAMLRVMRDVRALGKDGWNKHSGYNFRGIDATVNALGPAMRRHGIVPVPRLRRVEGGMQEVGRDRTWMRLCTVEVEYEFRHAASQTSLSAVVPGEAFDSGDKAVSKAMSVAYRTALLQTFILPTQEPDPDEFSPGAEPGRTEADVARDDVVAVMQSRGLDPRAVLRAYAARHNGMDLRVETDAAKLREFRHDLENDPDAVLAAAAPQPAESAPAEGGTGSTEGVSSPAPAQRAASAPAARKGAAGRNGAASRSNGRKSTRDREEAKA